MRHAIRDRLVGRAEQSAKNAVTVAASGYRAEALLHEARAAAYRQAAADVEELCPAVGPNTLAGAMCVAVECLELFQATGVCPLCRAASHPPTTPGAPRCSMATFAEWRPS